MKKRYKRTAKQYANFRKAFAKWTAKYKNRTDFASLNKTIGSMVLYRNEHLVNQTHSIISEYIAPDYTKYMAFVWRKFI